MGDEKTMPFPQSSFCPDSPHLEIALVLTALLATLTALVWVQPIQARTIMDELGREVEVPEHPERIVALAPSLTECVFALGQGDRVVGVTTFSNHPDQAQSLPRVGSYVNLDLERIVGLQPDLCLATKDGNPIRVIRQLEDLGVSVYALDPRDLEAVMQTLVKLGWMLQCEQKASRVVADMQQEIEAVQDRVQTSTNRPRVFFQIGISPIVSVGSNTFVHELITLAGGVNLAAGAKDYPRYSLEEVLVLDPDIMVINSMTKDSALLQETMAMWKQYPQIRAVKHNRVFTVNSDVFNRASPRLVNGLRILADLLLRPAGATRTSREE